MRPCNTAPANCMRANLNERSGSFACMPHGPIGAPGDTYSSRAALLSSGMHRNREGGIGGSGISGAGAESILLTDGYEDDVDNGDTILYTGHGGRDPRTKKQVDHQQFVRLNKSLRDNVASGNPVRLIRRDGSVFRYAGLYSVDDAYPLLGKSGFTICRYELTRVSTVAAPAVSSSLPPIRPGAAGPPRRKKVAGERIIRDTRQSLWVKNLYAYACQVCGIAIQTRAGAYAEGAHIVPLGGSHAGPDDPSNILCLCPNHHVLFDFGGMYVDPSLKVRLVNGSVVGALVIDPLHGLDPAHFASHRLRFGF